MSTLPLIWDYRPGQILCWTRHGAVTQSRFLAAAQRLAAQLPDTGHVINHCDNRYRFMLGFAAALLRGHTSLLPPSNAAGVLDELLQRYPGSCVLADTVLPPCNAPQIQVGDDIVDEWTAPVPQIAGDQRAAIVFTSGSTGAVQAHDKLWRTFHGTAQQAAQRLLPDGPANIVATVPPQHMYGLETTVLMALCAGAAAHDGKPFYPADVRDALHAVAEPRVLVTTPVHIRALLAARVRLPPLQLILSATAPLPAELAQAAEQAFGAPLHEIYGFTEAGSVASRRTTQSPLWTLYPGNRVTTGDEGVLLHSPHLPAPQAFPDYIELDAENRFHLGGRPGDMVKVAGKRASLSDLTLKLLEIPGVDDAVVFLPDAAERPAALVVGSASEREILAALSAKLDAVFLPRPLKKIGRLPRNEVGKLPRAALLQALRP